MFDTMSVARKIREARISLNMTQMNLADAMEVSYQAVSNWERGNSMPDISKLEQLCQILHLKLDDLLGTEHAARTLEKVIHPEADCQHPSEPITIAEIQEVAPLLPPKEMNQLIENTLENEETFQLSAIVGLAPYMDEYLLDHFIQKEHISHPEDLADIAPFLGSRTLDRLVSQADPGQDLSALYPFLSQENLDTLARSNPDRLPAMAPFLDSQSLDKLVSQAGPGRDLAFLYPFLSQENLDALAQSNPDRLPAMAPFLDSQSLDKLVSQADPGRDMSFLYPFLSQETLKKYAEKLALRH